MRIDVVAFAGDDAGVGDGAMPRAGVQEGADRKVAGRSPTKP